MMFGVLHPFIQTLDLLPLEIKPLMFVGDPVVILMELKISLIKLHEQLGIKGEGESDDNKVTLRYSTCLGACAQSPVFAIDHKMYGKLDEKKLNSMIEELKK